DAGVLSFVGTQTLGGTGSIMFGEGFGTIEGGNPGDSLTIGSGITIHGKNGFVGRKFSAFASNPITNDGTISADVAGGTIVLDPSALTNNGTIDSSNGGTIQGAQGLGS